MPSMFLAFVPAYIIYTLIDLIPIFKNKEYKIAAIYIALITLSIVVQLLLSLGVHIPSPARGMVHVVANMFRGNG